MTQPVRLVREVFLTVAAVLGVVCIVATLAGLVLDVRPLVFRSGSMAPAIDTGALAVARTVDAKDLVPGDIVSVTTRSGERVTHRLVETAPDGSRTQLTLKGDANTVPDEEVYVVAAAEKVMFDVPRLGYVVDAAVSPVGLFVLGLYVAGMLVLLLRRKPPGDGGSRPGRRRSDPGARRTARRSVAAGSAAMLLVASPAAAAPWTDAAPVTGGTLTARTIPAPVASCGLLSVGSVQISWTAVAGATGYVLHHGNAGATVETVGAGVTSKNFTGLITGGTFWVEAQTSYGSVTWKSAASNSLGYSVLLVLVGLCG